MARIIGVEIPGEKRIDIALRYIYGIGPVNAKVILEKAKKNFAGLKSGDKVKLQLTPYDLSVGRILVETKI